MKYYLKEDRLILLKKEDDSNEPVATIEVQSKEDFQHSDMEYPHRKMLINMMESGTGSKAESIGSCVLGMIMVPDHNRLTDYKVSFGYYIINKRIVLIESEGRIAFAISKLKDNRYQENTSIVVVFFQLLEYLLKDDLRFLQNYEKKLTEMEEHLLDEVPKDFYQKVIRYRKDLLVLHTFYEQLIAVGDEIESNPSGVFTSEEKQLFRIFSGRMEHLYSHVERLRETILQIRELYQSQLDMRQNQIMSFLTVVTTIFLPLSILVGWYGMNFSNMPELHWKYGYPSMVLMSILIIIAEIYYFKKNKMF